MLDRALNRSAILLLRLFPPLKVRAILARMARHLPTRDTVEQVRSASALLGQRGTCLSRALTLQARAPWLDVVIGVQPAPAGTVRAHAWLEARGQPIEAEAPLGDEIARIRAAVGDSRG